MVQRRGRYYTLSVCGVVLRCVAWCMLCSHTHDVVGAAYHLRYYYLPVSTNQTDGFFLRTHSSNNIEHLSKSKKHVTSYMTMLRTYVFFTHGTAGPQKAGPQNKPFGLDKTTNGKQTALVLLLQCLNPINNTQHTHRTNQSHRMHPGTGAKRSHHQNQSLTPKVSPRKKFSALL